MKRVPIKLFLALRFRKKTKDGRIRRRCPVPDCGTVVVVRLPQHLRRAKKHKDKLTEEEIARLCATAELYRKPALEDITPEKVPRRESVPKSLKPVPVSESSVARQTSPAEHSSGAPRRRLPVIPDTLISKTKTYTRLVKLYYFWIQTRSGGDIDEATATQMSNRVQAFFDFNGTVHITCLNMDNLEAWTNHISKKFKAGTVLFYLRALKRFVDFLFSNDHINVGRNIKLTGTLRNIVSSLEKQRKIQDVQSQVQVEADRLPAAVRHTYFNSAYIVSLRQSLMSGRPDRSLFIPYRDYLILAISFYNGHRPVVIENLTNEQFRLATAEEVPGEEPLSERMYATMVVAKHKTTKSSGAAGVSVPPLIYRELRAFQRLTEVIFGPRQPGAGVFLTQTGDEICTASTVNDCIQRTYTASGTAAKYPQHINCTVNRKLVTSAARDSNPANAALVAAQLCHGVGQADRIYRLQAKRQQSAQAVHIIDKAVKESAAHQSQTPLLAHEFLEAGGSDESTKDLWDWKINLIIEEPVPKKPREQTQPGTSGLEKPKEEVEDWAAAADQVKEFTAEVVENEGKTEDTDEESGKSEVIAKPQALKLDIKKMVTEWAASAREKVPHVTFSNMPESRDELTDALIVLLESLDYAQIHEEAQYWVHQAGIDALAETANIDIADSLRDELQRLFDFDIDAMWGSETPRSRGGNPAVHTVMTVLGLCRIATTFGASLQPTHCKAHKRKQRVIYDSSTSGEDLDHAASAPKGKEAKRRVKTDSRQAPPVDDSSPSGDDLPHAVSLPKAEKGKRRVMPEDVEHALSQINPEAIVSSMAQ